VTGEGRAQEIVERGLAAAGGLPCAVIVEDRYTVNVRWALTGLTTNGATRGRTVTAIVAAPVPGGLAVATLSRGGVGVEDVAELVGQVRVVAAGGSAAEDAAELMDGGVSPDWDEPAVETGPSALAPVTDGLAQVLARSRAQGREAFGFALHEVSTTWLGTSAGTRRRHVQPRATAELNGKSHERSRSAWEGQARQDPADLDLPAMDAEVAARLGWQGRRFEITPGRYDTVLPPTAVADLMIYLYWSADARSAAEGRSVFSRPGGGTRVGDRLSPMPLRLASDPGTPGLSAAPHVLTAASSPFASVFDNGLATTPQDWIAEGVLRALPNSRHTARLSGLPFTPTVDNLTLSAPDGAGVPGALVEQLDRGLLLTCLWYIREVDPTTLLLTGLTRDGVYLVDGGEVVGAVSNFRFNESPVDLLDRTRAVSASEITYSREWGEYFTRTAMPGLLVDGFNMSTASEAS